MDILYKRIYISLFFILSVSGYYSSGDKPTLLSLLTSESLYTAALRLTLKNVRGSV